MSHRILPNEDFVENNFLRESSIAIRADSCGVLVVRKRANWGKRSEQLRLPGRKPAYSGEENGRPAAADLTAEIKSLAIRGLNTYPKAPASRAAAMVSSSFSIEQMTMRVG